jgi:large subunit ribosomal protein L24
MKLKIKKGDIVKVLAGEDKNKTGRVLQVYADKTRILIEGINMVKKHQKPSQLHPNGGIVEMEAPIHYSNANLITKA